MASLISNIVGHETQKQRLLSAIINKSLPHALVFSGPSGIGKMKLATAIAQCLVCETPRHAMACGSCGACIRAEKNQSENIRILAPDGLQIKISQVREILDFLSFASDSQKRVVIIDQAHQLNPQASNALLKTLEEPPQDVYFILISSDARLLMPTIRSRSQVVLFKTLSCEDLEQLKPGLPDWAYASARGQVSKLLEFTQSDRSERRSSDLSFFENFWSNKNFILDVDIKEHAKDRASAGAVLKNWFIFTRDLIVLQQATRDQVLNSDQITTLIKLELIPVEKLYDFSAAVLQALHDIDKLDITLLFESLWVKYARTV